MRDGSVWPVGRRIWKRTFHAFPSLPAPWLWPLSYISGSVWLRCELAEERPEHPHRLHTLHVHFCCNRSAALQGQILLLHRWVQSSGEGLQVRNLEESSGLRWIMLHQNLVNWREVIQVEREFSWSFFSSHLWLGVIFWTMTRIKSRLSQENGRSTSSITTMSCGPFWRSSPCPQERAGPCEWRPILASLPECQNILFMSRLWCWTLNSGPERSSFLFSTAYGKMLGNAFI